jgi:hypothetical protein
MRNTFEIAPRQAMAVPTTTANKHMAANEWTLKANRQLKIATPATPKAVLFSPWVCNDLKIMRLPSTAAKFPSTRNKARSE